MLFCVLWLFIVIAYTLVCGIESMAQWMNPQTSLILVIGTVFALIGFCTDAEIHH
jgi:hypothetical protein